MPEKNVIIKADQPKQYVFPFLKKIPLQTIVRKE